MTKAGAAPSGRVLVVDDEPQNLELMEEILSPEGYEVFLVPGSQEGMAAAHDKKPDLIILDLMMPNISGFEVCARLKTDPQTGGIPILFVTALTSVGDKERAMAAGGDDFLTKPIQRAELLARVEALLRVRHLNRDLDRALAYLHEMQAGGPDEPPMERPAAPPPEAAAAVILVADRDPVARKLYADLFRGAGCVIHEAREGSEALQIAQQKPIDVVLLDVMMPDMSGLDVLANLGEFIPDSPVILIAGEPSPEHTLAALRLGAFDFLVKGVTGEAITATVSRALERRRHAIRNRRLIQQAETKARELLAVLRQQAEESGRIPHQ